MRYSNRGRCLSIESTIILAVMYLPDHNYYPGTESNSYQRCNNGNTLVFDVTLTNHLKQRPNHLRLKHGCHPTSYASELVADLIASNPRTGRQGKNPARRVS